VEDLTEPRFPSWGPDDGGYESYYLKAAHPSEPKAVWIRHTVHKRPGAEPTGSLWCTFFDRDAGSPVAIKQTLDSPRTAGDELLRLGNARFGRGEASAHVETDGREAGWDLRFETSEEPLHHLPRDFMYTAPLPRTKLLTPLPAARFSGGADLDGREHDLGGWTGMVGHNWGAEHAERWIWLHASGFEGHGPDTWLDLGIGRIKVGRFTVPWIANGALSLDGARHTLGGPGKARKTKIEETPTGVRFRLAGSGLGVKGSVTAPREAFVGWVYADPDGSEHHVVNCSVADVELEAAGVSLRAPAGGVYELGMRERDHGMEIQPYSDG
jgi:hypothetical protein